MSWHSVACAGPEVPTPACLTVCADRETPPRFTAHPIIRGGFILHIYDSPPQQKPDMLITRDGLTVFRTPFRTTFPRTPGQRGPGLGGKWSQRQSQARPRSPWGNSPGDTFSALGAERALGPPRPATQSTCDGRGPGHWEEVHRGLCTRACTRVYGHMRAPVHACVPCVRTCAWARAGGREKPLPAALAVVSAGPATRAGEAQGAGPQGADAGTLAAELRDTPVTGPSSCPGNIRWVGRSVGWSVGGLVGRSASHGPRRPSPTAPGCF